MRARMRASSSKRTTTPCATGAARSAVAGTGSSERAWVPLGRSRFPLCPAERHGRSFGAVASTSAPMAARVMRANQISATCPANLGCTVQFVHTREMQHGLILALVRPYAYANVNDTGGDLIIIDTSNYVENTQPAAAGSSLTGPAQTLATTNPVLTVPGPSPGGRFYSGFPLWDGTGRILVSWSQCRLLNTSVTPNTIIPCSATTLAVPNAQSAPPLFSVWMFDPSQNTLQPIMQPTDGIMITDLVAAQPRALPAEIVDQEPGVTLDQDMYDAGVGEIDIRSVYDIDGVDTAKPNIPAVADPAQTPPDIVRKLNAVAVLAEPAIRDKMELLGVAVIGSTQEELARHLRAETALWGPVIKAANIRGE